VTPVGESSRADPRPPVKTFLLVVECVARACGLVELLIFQGLRTSPSVLFHPAPRASGSSCERIAGIRNLSPGDEDKGETVALLVDDDTTINDAWETTRDPS